MTLEKTKIALLSLAVLSGIVALQFQPADATLTTQKINANNILNLASSSPVTMWDDYQPPVQASDDFAETEMDTDVTIEVLANDFDKYGNELFVDSITQFPENGSVVINDDGTITYTPNEGFVGADYFEYKVTDSRGGYDTAQVTVDVIDGTGGNTESTLLVKSTDLAGNAFSGQWVEVWQNDKIIKQGYTPFSYILQTGTQYSIHIYDDTAENKFFDHWNDGNTSPTITVTPSSDVTLTAFFRTSVTPTNNPPDAVPDQAQTKMNTSVKINVLANDVDSDGDTLTISSISINPQKGSAIINSDKTITYTPANEFVGTDSFSYKISDGKGGEDTAQVTVNVLNVIRNITQTKSGLIAFDPLNNETQTMQQLKANQRFWNYGGSAESLYEPDAPFEYFKDSEGLHIGVQSPQQGNYSGYYAVTSLPNATLFHSIINTTARTIPAGDFQNGLYVQENIFGNVDYLTCVSITNSGGTTWQLVFAQGNQVEAKQFKLLWKDSNPNPPLTRDCTIITNGVNYLKLYMDGVKVYENATMNLQMPTPFSYFLEPQTSYAGAKMFGIYRDFYATTSEFVKLVNIPSNANRVDLIGTTGTVLVSPPVTNNTSTIDVGAYHFPLAANIKVYDNSNNEIASTTGQANIYGGNIYTVNPP